MRSAALRLFLTSIAINAALGIWAILVDDFGDTQGKVLLSSFLVSAGMLAVLINGAPVSRRILWPTPLVAVLSLLLGVGLLLVFVWAETDSEPFTKGTATTFVVGGAATFSGLLALLPLRPAHQVLRFTAHLLIAGLTATVIGVIWAESGGDAIARVIGVQSILVAAFSLAVPALSRFVPVEEPTAVSSTGHYCPGCGAELDDHLLFGEPVACINCKRVFLVIEKRTELP